MTEAEIIALITTILQNGPALTADAVAMVKAVIATFTGNPNATAADAKTAIDNALSQAAADDAAVEQAQG